MKGKTKAMRIATRIAFAKNLQELKSGLSLLAQESDEITGLVDRIHNLTRLRTFGGTNPNRLDAWSWDEARILIGESWDGLRIITREGETTKP